MATATITRTSVRNLSPPRPGSRKYRVHDDKISGYFVEVSASGRKTHWLRYTDSRGRRREAKIGKQGDITADQARKRALELKAIVALGGDPAGDRDRLRAVPTFGAFVADRFIPHLHDTIRSHAEYETILRLRVVPYFGRLHLDEISRGHVAAFRRKLIDEGLSNARVNRHLAVLCRALNLALRWELYAGPNPARSPGLLREEPRDLFLTEVQLRALMRALADDPDQVAAGAIALLALTGARKMEILGARFEHVDLDRKLLTVPLAKSGRRRHVVLSDAALAVLRMQRRAPGQEFVFPSARRPGRSIVDVRTVWDRAKAAAGLPTGVRLHDMRHTFASLCINSGVPLYDVSKLLGHTKQSMTARYAHLRDDRLLEAANAVGSIATRATAA
jgi:integrase